MKAFLLLTPAACAAATLTACGTSGRDQVLDGAAPDPVVEVRRETVTVCPAELFAPAPARPVPAADAVVQTNAAGGAWLAATIAHGEAGWVVVADARASCPGDLE